MKSHKCDICGKETNVVHTTDIGKLSSWDSLIYEIDYCSECGSQYYHEMSKEFNLKSEKIYNDYCKEIFDLKNYILDNYKLKYQNDVKKRN